MDALCRIGGGGAYACNSGGFIWYATINHMSVCASWSLDWDTKDKDNELTGGKRLTQALRITNERRKG